MGNIPFDTTEAEVHALLAQIGSIKNFRCVLQQQNSSGGGGGSGRAMPMQQPQHTSAPAVSSIFALCRLIMDRETGKPKGFGFCEFHSKEDAESAYRNLNNTMFKNRQIRIDFAEENISDRVGYKPRGKYRGAGTSVLLLWQHTTAARSRNRNSSRNRNRNRNSSSGWQSSLCVSKETVLHNLAACQ